MLVNFAILLTCQLLGEISAKALALPVPGPVLGMAFMFAALMLRDAIRRARPNFTLGHDVETTGRNLLSHLSLLFVPAGVGIVGSLDVFEKYGIALAVALLVSTLLALLVAVMAFRLVSRLMGETP
ncbi:MAG: CidA/LrgA family protein [Hyphomicrobiales bacterium]|nr:CidA/LrgA family protein [Hyphomicrobiales bacterium]MDE2114336.1 CidA/LrgA family protein [Hyphomicrobiales bacterium]